MSNGQTDNPTYFTITFSQSKHSLCTHTHTHSHTHTHTHTLCMHTLCYKSPSSLSPPTHHHPPQTADWTVSLTKYMQEGVWRICNESMLMGRHDSYGGGRTPSVNHPPSPSDETLTEINHWQYMLHLSSWLYEVRV